ncbi:hypothetical protein D3C80_924050 [compost metagenome]
MNYKLAYYVGPILMQRFYDFSARPSLMQVGVDCVKDIIGNKGKNDVRGSLNEAGIFGMWTNTQVEMMYTPVIK